MKATNSKLNLILFIIIIIIINYLIKPVELQDYETISDECGHFFPSCLCSLDNQMYLFCNDPNLKRIPVFKENSNLTFSKVDFSHSGITRIYSNDLKHLKLGKLLPITNYNLDFDNISQIDDAAFKNINLLNNIEFKLRFSNSYLWLNSSSSKRPFEELKAFKLHLNNISNEYLTNEMFDEAIINELLIENMANFISFTDSNHLPTGKLKERFIAIKSYNKIDTLCSHSLPSFIDQETFHEIIIKKCSSLKQIKAFTFYKYSHLKQLTLISNGFIQINKNSFSHLKQLEMLDLSFNPISFIDDYAFNDLTSLKRLYLEATLIKVIHEYTLYGLYHLNELKLANSNYLNEINGKAFDTLKKSLKDLNLKETNISLLDTVLNDGINPPYVQNINWKNKTIWLDGLNLTYLNIETKAKQFETNNNILAICKLIRYIPSTTLIIMHRNQKCTCLIYAIYYRNRINFKHLDYLKTPVCYRATQIISQNEMKCNLNEIIETHCFNNNNNNNLLVTTNATTTATKLVKQTKSFTSLIRTKASFPKLNFRKLFKVIAVIVLLTFVSILFTVIILRFTRRSNKNNKRKKQAFSSKKQQKIVMHTNKESSNLKDTYITRV
jgi:hypothetical protein